MRPLSATEAITPAIQRTRDVLARPFRLGTYLKIAAVAFFAELGSFNLNFNTSGGRGNLHSLPPAFLAFIVAFAVAIAVVSLIIGLIFFYIGSRLQLVLVEMVATRQKIVAPLWRKFSTVTWRWLGLRLLFILVVVLAAAAIAVPLVLYFGITFRHGFHHPVFSFAAIAFFIFAALVFLLAFIAVYMALRDFALPSFAFEDVPISEALRRVGGLVAAEPGPVALFLFLQFLLTLVAGMAAEIVIVMVLLVSAIPFVIVGVVLFFALHHAGPAGTAVLIVAAIFGGLIYFAWAFCVGIAGLCPVYIFSQAYSLYFLGGRYPMLGDLLESSEPPPAFPYPAYPPPGPFSPPNVTPPPAPLAG